MKLGRLAPVEVESGPLLRNSPVALLIPHPESDALWLHKALISLTLPCLIPNLNSPNQELLRAVPVYIPRLATSSLTVVIFRISQSTFHLENSYSFIKAQLLPRLAIQSCQVTRT